MPNLNGSASNKEQLNRSSPAAADAQLGTTLTDLITNFNALLAKLDANHAAATDHVATLKVKDLESRSA